MAKEILSQGGAESNLPLESLNQSPNRKGIEQTPNNARIITERKIDTDWTAPVRPGWGKRALDARWKAAREKAGINPNDETKDMNPNDAIVYRMLSEDKSVSSSELARTLRPNIELEKARGSVAQSLIKLRKILPNSINKTIVNVGTTKEAEYLLVDVGKEQEVIDRYAQYWKQREGENRIQKPQRSRRKSKLAKHKRSIEPELTSEPQITTPETGQEETDTSGVNLNSEEKIAIDVVDSSPEVQETSEQVILEEELPAFAEQEINLDENIASVIIGEQEDKLDGAFLGPTERYWIAASVADFNGQYILEEAGVKLESTQIHQFTSVLGRRAIKPEYNESIGRGIQAALNRYRENPRSFQKNELPSYVRDAIKLFSKVSEKNPGDVFWEIFYAMRPRLVPQK